MPWSLFFGSNFQPEFSIFNLNRNRSFEKRAPGKHKTTSSSVWFDANLKSVMNIDYKLKPITDKNVTAYFHGSMLLFKTNVSLQKRHIQSRSLYSNWSIFSGLLISRCEDLMAYESELTIRSRLETKTSCPVDSYQLPFAVALRRALNRPSHLVLPCTFPVIFLFLRPIHAFFSTRKVVHSSVGLSHLWCVSNLFCRPLSGLKSWRP